MRAAAISLCCVSAAASAQTANGSTADSGVGRVGQRQQGYALPDRISSIDRVASRVESRVESRIDNRIDQDYSPQANAATQLNAASNKLRNAGHVRRR